CASSPSMRVSRAAAASTSIRSAATPVCACRRTCGPRANSVASAPVSVTALRGALLTFTGDPFATGDDALHYEADAIVVMANGRIAESGPAAELLPRLPLDAHVTT